MKRLTVLHSDALPLPAADLTEIQCSMADAGRGYESVGVELGERLGLLGAMLEQRLGARREAASIASWLKEKEQTLSQQQPHQRGSPSKTEAVQEQALQNKVSDRQTLN